MAVNTARARRDVCQRLEAVNTSTHRNSSKDGAHNSGPEGGGITIL